MQDRASNKQIYTRYIYLYEHTNGVRPNGIIYIIHIIQISYFKSFIYIFYIFIKIIKTSISLINKIKS